MDQELVPTEAAAEVLSEGSPTELRASRYADQRAKHPLVAFAVRRLASGVVILLAVSVLIFVATNVLPGNVASIVLGKQASPQAVQALNREIGLDKPLIQRYAEWLGGLLHGNLGDSAVQAASGSKVTVSSIIAQPARNTLVLAVLTAILLVPLSLALGVFAAMRAGRPADHAISLVTLSLMSMPEFVIGALLILVFFTALNLLQPLSIIAPGQNPLSHVNLLILPVATLLATSLAWTTRLVRVGVLETLRSDYVAQARLNGLPERRVLSRYALRNGLAPSVQVFAQALQILIGAVVVTEVVFDYPGLGTQLVNAVNTRDFTVVQSVAMLFAALYLVLNIFADFIVVLLVPKLRTTG